MPDGRRSLNTTSVAAGSVAAAVLLPIVVSKWDAWLNSHHEHEEEYELADGSGKRTKVGSCRPRSIGDMARGGLSCLAFLVAADLFVARRMRDDTSRYFMLHTLANTVITISSASEMLAVLRDPINSGVGKCNVLPTYMIPSLFTYHLSVFKNVPREEWEHHLLFGLGLCLPQLAYCVGPVQNAIGFFMCGLPGGIDYAMLAAVKEGLIRSDTEKLWNSRIQCWCRAPGVLLSSYAILLLSRYSTVKGPSRAMAYLAFLLATFNGQYYMQKVVANTSLKLNGHGAC